MFSSYLIRKEHVAYGFYLPEGEKRAEKEPFFSYEPVCTWQIL